MTYVNSSFFAVLLLPVLLQRLLGSNGIWRHLIRQRRKHAKYAPLAEDERNPVVKTDSEDGRLADSDHFDDEPNSNILTDNTRVPESMGMEAVEERLSIRETAHLSLEFSILWVNSRYKAFDK